MPNYEDASDYRLKEEATNLNRLLSKKSLSFWHRENVNRQLSSIRLEQNKRLVQKEAQRLALAQPRELTITFNTEDMSPEVYELVTGLPKPEYLKTLTYRELEELKELYAADMRSNTSPGGYTNRWASYSLVVRELKSRDRQRGYPRPEKYTQPARPGVFTEHHWANFDFSTYTDNMLRGVIRRSCDTKEIVAFEKELERRIAIRTAMCQSVIYEEIPSGDYRVGPLTTIVASENTYVYPSIMSVIDSFETKYFASSDDFHLSFWAPRSQLEAVGEDLTALLKASPAYRVCIESPENASNNKYVVLVRNRDLVKVLVEITRKK